MTLRPLLAALLCQILLSGGNAAERPNFVFIVSEDNSIHYLRHFFPGGAETPAIERLAREGLTFDHAFSNSPVCSVARTTLATSCYAPRIGAQFHRKYKHATLPENIRLFHHYLQEAGYHTTNNAKTDYNVQPATGWVESSRRATWRSREPDQPFFHLQSHAQSHESSLHFDRETFENEPTRTDPATVTLPDYFPNTPLFRYTVARYHDRIGVIDGIVADTVAKLEEDGVLEDTFIFYFGDHGGVLPRSKGYPYQSGLHVPLVVRIPENFAHLVDGARGDRVEGFVSFVDFGPTVLHLAGVEVSADVNGQPFLGPDIAMAEVNRRDEAFGYADRFDEKYDFIRSLRKGRYHYLRAYQNWLPDGLQNNYRYKMLAYTEWRDLYRGGKLNDVQSQFFRPRPVELLFDVEADPHEVNNLALDPSRAELLRDLRGRLDERLKAMPDLSFFPESHLVNHAMTDPVGFGQENRGAIVRYIDIADLATRPFHQAKAPLEAALRDDDPFARYWGAMVCSSFGERASALAPAVEALLEDEKEVVRLRAIEFLGLIGRIDARVLLTGLINTTSDPVVATEALNSLVHFVDHEKPEVPYDAESLRPAARGADVERRVPYLKGETQNRQKEARKPRAGK